jgi:agmatinase
MRTIIRGLEGINLVACDIVEVAPAYDTNAELTTMAAADTLYEVMTLMVKKGPLSEMVNKTIDYETVLQTKPKKEL